MNVKNNDLLTPRNGHTLEVGIVTRISGCANQKELSLHDQEDHSKEWVTDRHSGAIHYTTIATKGKGEALDRPELEVIEKLLRQGHLDLVVLEDLGRLVRGSDAVRLLGIAKDQGTRVIVINDCIDTLDSTWEENALEATASHVGHNAHTSKRIKQKTMNRFTKQGGATARPIYGYLVPQGAKFYDLWGKDPSAEKWILEGARRLKTCLNFSEVADWFNQNHVPVGPYCRLERWDGSMVRRLYSNCLLKGVASRGTKTTVKNNETGRRVAVKNPDGPRYWPCPHLAYLSAAEFDELDFLLDQRHGSSRRKKTNGKDPLLKVPRKRTRFPGQHSRCFYCGCQHVWGGNGLKCNLMCGGAKGWTCWNSIGFNGALTVKRLVQGITSELYRLDQFDEQFQHLVKLAVADSGGGLGQRLDQLERDEAALALEKRNVQQAIAQFGAIALTKQMLADLDVRERNLIREKQEIERLRNQKLQLPQSTIELRRMLEEQISKLAETSPEFGHVMRQLVPELSVYLVRLCDGGHLLPRAKVTLALDGLIPDAGLVPGLSQLLSHELTLDLFDPPQRERIRAQAVQLANQGLTAKAIAELIEEKPTATAVSNALALDRKMRELGLSSPYVVVTEPPSDYPKLRRHKNPRYRFALLEGYQPPPM